MPSRVIHSRLADLPTESLAGGALVRTAVRGDDSLVTINWFHPTDIETPPPHTHPFDQISFVFAGTVEFFVADETYIVSAGESLQIPADVPHTARLVGDEVALNVDVYAPVREDYLFLVQHQEDAFDPHG